MSEGPQVSVSQEYLSSMKRQVEDLKTLMEVSAIISSTLDFNELITLVMEKAKRVMDAEACSILLYNRETNKLEFEVALCADDSACDILKDKVTLSVGEGIAGWVAENLKPLLICDVRQDPRFSKNADDQTGFHTKSLIAVPLIGRSGLIGVAEILNPIRKDCFQDYDSEIFQTLCRQVAIAIENSLFHRDSIARERLKQELDIAASLQNSFLPEYPVIHRKNLAVSAVNICAAQVGGDLYDFIEPADSKVGVIIGDVSGKGVSGALYMAKVISDFRFLACGDISPDSVLNKLNASLSKSPRGMFLTAIYMIVDTSSGVLSMSGAGHPPFIRISRNAVDVISPPSGPPLGIMPMDYPASTFALERGDRLLLLTDGVFEAKDKAGKRIGFDAIVEFIRKNRDHEDLVDKIVGLVEDFAKGVEQADDLTIVEINWGRGNK